MNNALSASRAAAFNSAPGRLHRICNYSYRLGDAGLDAADAEDLIADAVWADGVLPVDRPSRRRAWMLSRDRAISAFYSGAKAATLRFAREAVAASGGDAYRSLYTTAWHASPSVYDDQDIVDAVRQALAEADMPRLPEASPLYPIRRAASARAAGCDDELRSFAIPKSRPCVASAQVRADHVACLISAAAARVAVASY